MASKKAIEFKFETLCKLSNLTKTEDCEYFLSYDFNSYYGGYSLSLVKNDTGACYNAFNISCCQRHNSNEFYQLLSGLVAGIEFVNQIVKKSNCLRINSII